MTAVQQFFYPRKFGPVDPLFSNVRLLINADGAVVDQSTYANALTSDVTMPSVSASALTGSGSMNFSGLTEGMWFQMANTADLATADWHLQLSFRLDATLPLNTGKILWTSSRSTSNSYPLQAYVDTSGRIVARGLRYNLEGGFNITREAPVVPGSWYSIDLVRSGASVSLYVNAALVGSSTLVYPATLASSGYHTIGGYTDPGYAWPGLIDAVRFTLGATRPIAIPTQPFPTS